MNPIQYIAAARVADRCRFAQHVVQSSKQSSPVLYEQKFDKILDSTQLIHNNRLTITDEHVGHIHYEADPALIYLIITAPSYPQRTAFQVLSEARAQFDKHFGDEMSKATTGSLSKRCKPMFEELVQKYEQPSNIDKVSNVQHQVHQVKDMMQDNIKAALNNTENLETLLDISDNMKNDAFSFNRSTTEAKKRMQWKNLQMKLLIAFFVLLIVAVVIGSVVVRRKGSTTPEA
ncbi:unnamed protein product [Agarophyton chilense]